MLLRRMLDDQFRWHNQLWQRTKHIKGSKECYLLGQDKTSKFSGESLFVKLQNDTKTTAKRSKTTENEVKS